MPHVFLFLCFSTFDSFDSHKLGMVSMDAHIFICHKIFFER